MPIICVYVDRNKCYFLMELLTKLQKLYGGEIILDLQDKVETDQFVLMKNGNKPFFKAKQEDF